MPAKSCRCAKCSLAKDLLAKNTTKNTTETKTLVELTGKIVVSGHPEYVEAKENRNQLYKSNPFVIVFVFNQQDVKNAVMFAKQSDTCIRIRSGRNSPYCSINNGLIIDVSEMKSISIDFKNKTTTFESGLNQMELTNFLTHSGLFAITSLFGFLSQAGFALGGGLCLFSRIKGIACNSIVACKITIANGKTLICDKKQNQDLLWALKGAGIQNFGIVTELTLQLYEQPPFITTWKFLFLSVNDFMEIYNTWQLFAPFADPRLSSECKCYQDHIEINGIFMGTLEELGDLLHELEELNGGELTKTQIIFTDYYKIDNLPSNYNPYLKFSPMFTQKPFPHEALITIQYFLSIVPQTNFHFTSLALGLKKINTISFPHSKALTYNQIEAEWNDETITAKVLNWVQNFRVAMLPYFKGSYANIPCGEIAKFEEEYYGSNLKRLQQIKKKYDVVNTFHSEQTISLAS